jgi:phytoene synthase
MTEQTGYCEGLVREADKDRFLATLFAPGDRRADLFALYAFDLETAAIRHRVREPLVGEIRLQWWHDALGGTTEAAGHPVASAILAVLERHGIPVSIPQALIDARRAALYADGEQSEAEFEVMASETAGAIYQMAAHILSGPGEAARLAAHHAGVATLAAQAGEKWAEEARRHLEAARSLIGVLPEAALPAFLPLVLASKQRMALAQWRKQWILWRASKNLAAWL